MIKKKYILIAVLICIFGFRVYKVNSDAPDLRNFEEIKLNQTVYAYGGEFKVASIENKGKYMHIILDAKNIKEASIAPKIISDGYVVRDASEFIYSKKGVMEGFIPLESDFKIKKGDKLVICSQKLYPLKNFYILLKE